MALEGPAVSVVGRVEMSGTVVARERESVMRELMESPVSKDLGTGLSSRVMVDIVLGRGLKV